MRTNAALWSYTNKFHPVTCCDHTKCKLIPGSEIEFHADLMWRVTWQALSMCPKTPSAFKQIALLSWAVALLETSPPGSVTATDLTREARPCRFISRWKLQCCTTADGTSVTGSSLLWTQLCPKAPAQVNRIAVLAGAARFPQKKSNWGLDHFWVYKVPWCHCGNRRVNPNVLVK